LRELFDDATKSGWKAAFGGGEHLIAEPKRQPQVGFIGIDPFINAGQASRRDRRPQVQEHPPASRPTRRRSGVASRRKPVTLRSALPRSVAEAPSLETPLRAGQKRRRHRAGGAGGGAFRFASDIPDYVAWTLMRLMRSPDFEWTAQQADDWRKPWPEFCGTRYEAKAKREGRAPCYWSSSEDRIRRAAPGQSGRTAGRHRKMWPAGKPSDVVVGGLTARPTTRCRRRRRELLEVRECGVDQWWDVPARLAGTMMIARGGPAKVRGLAQNEDRIGPGRRPSIDPRFPRHPAKHGYGGDRLLDSAPWQIRPVRPRPRCSATCIRAQAQPAE